MTFPYLEKIPYRAQLQARVKKLNEYEKYSTPFRKGPYVFFRKNAGLQNQSVLYIQKGQNGAPEVLIDPNTLSEDGTVQLGVFAPSKDAKYAVYGISRSGSDWQEYKVMELATRKTLADSLEWVKVSGVAWQGDGFYYSRYPAPAKGQEKASINENHQVYFHRVGTPQSDDVVVYSDAANRQRFHIVETTEDERFAVLSIMERGKGKDGNSLFVRDLSKGEREFAPVIAHDRRRELQRRGQRRRQAADRDEPQGAELTRDSGGSQAAGGGELEDRAARAAPSRFRESRRPVASCSSRISRT